MDLSTTIRKGFLTGLVLIAPLAITFVVVSVVYGWLTSTLDPLLAIVGADTDPFVQVFALLVLFGSITLLGVVVRRGIMDESFITELDRMMEAIPVVKTIYSSARQASNALIGHENQFERVVLVEWPEDDVHTIGFVTNESPDAVTVALDGASAEVRYNVFIPMSPNPMAGFLAIVPESRITKTDLPVRQGLQMVITTGMGSKSELSLEDLRAL
jgi:uncharacterized membrane protein